MDVFGQALQQGIAPAIVVAIYLIITKIIETRKESSTAKLTESLIKSITNISDYIIDINKNIIEKDKDKCKIAIEDSMYSSAMRLINFVSATLINNHIDINKENVLINIHNIVNTEFYNVYATLSLYKISGNVASDFLDKAWMQVIEKDIIDILYNTESLSKEDKILSFTNKINYKFQTYITYVTNHVIK